MLSAVFFCSFLKICLIAVLFCRGKDPPKEPGKLSIAKQVSKPKLHTQQQFLLKTHDGKF